MAGVAEWKCNNCGFSFGSLCLWCSTGLACLCHFGAIFTVCSLALTVSLSLSPSLWSKLSVGATVNVKLAKLHFSANLLQFPGPNNKCNVAHFQCNANSRFSPQLRDARGRKTPDSPGNFLMQQEDYPRQPQQLRQLHPSTGAPLLCFCSCCQQTFN